MKLAASLSTAGGKIACARCRAIKIKHLAALTRWGFLFGLAPEIPHLAKSFLTLKYDFSLYNKVRHFFLHVELHFFLLTTSGVMAFKVIITLAAY
jgi:hypothetical protein